MIVREGESGSAGEPRVLVFGSAHPATASRLAILDRDGVLNRDLGHVAARSDTHWIPGAARALEVLDRAGFVNVIATNQAGIAKGLYSEAEFLDYMAWYTTELRNRGARISAVYYCPHHPTKGRAPYLQDCLCRKPKPGMLLCALRDFGMAVGDCMMIGDKPTDMAAARAAGVRGYLFEGGDLHQFVTHIASLFPVVPEAGMRPSP